VRRRLRELGYAVGRFPAGERNALVDVPGVLVGHRTLNEGERLRTGVTAILPHGDNLYAEKVLGACHVVNGYGIASTAGSRTPARCACGRSTRWRRSPRRPETM
jgi:L-aminopeptidase/D-esterase-like protein